MRLQITGQYPPDWQAIAERVKDEAGRRCIRCGHPEGDRLKGEQKILVGCDSLCSHPHDGKLRQLTVHHLDGNKSNVRWWNLLALCQFCHLSIQGRVIPERPFLWEHTAWFKVYAAGFYAWWHGQQQITRAEAEAELEHWLAVGQPWLYAAPEPTLRHFEKPR